MTQIFLSVTFGPFEAQVALQTILVSTFTDNFLRRILSVKLVHNDGVHAVCQNSFLRRGRVNSVLCIRFRSLMNLIIHLPRLRDICNCLCFVCIAVGGEDCMISFFTFFFFCHQSSFCNRILISCLNHMRQQSVCTPFLCIHTRLSLLLCDESSRNSSVSKEHLFHLNVFGSDEYCSILHLYLYRFQVLSWIFCDGGNAIILIHGIFFSILEVRLLPVIFFFMFVMVSNHTHLMMRVSSAHLSSRNCSPNSVLWFLSIYKWTSFSDALIKDCCYCCRCRRCCFRGGRDHTALWRQRFPDARWKVWPSFQRCSNLVNHARDIPR